MEKQCKQCSNTFPKKVTCSLKDWEQKTKFCSRQCADTYKKGKPNNSSTKFKKGYVSPKKGIPLSEETKQKLSSSLKGRKPNSGSFKKGGNVGENHKLWKGELAKVRTKHTWVKAHKGKASECTHCGKTSKEFVIDWANIDHQYKRNLNDYISLCRSCHRKYDIEHNGYRKL